jgi:hypothetical protein
MFHLGRSDRTMLEFVLFDEGEQTVSKHPLAEL